MEYWLERDDLQVSISYLLHFLLICRGFWCVSSVFKIREAGCERNDLGKKSGNNRGKLPFFKSATDMSSSMRLFSSLQLIVVMSMTFLLVLRSRRNANISA